MKRNIYSTHNEGSPNKFRQSVSILSSQLIRNSFSQQSRAPNLYRQSYCPVIRPRQTISIGTNINRRIQSVAPQVKKNMFTQLKSTLNDLQKKINLANHKLNSYKNILEEEQEFQIDNRVNEFYVQDEKNQSIFSLQSTIVQTQSKILFQKRQNINQKSYNSKAYYLNHLVSATTGLNNRAFQHFCLSLKIFQNRHKIVTPSFSDIEQRKICLPRYKEDIGKKTLVIDIDQTLIHCQQQEHKSYDIALPIEVQSGAIAKAYITIRPYAISFLKRMSKHYQIIAFTASHESYADKVLDQIDPDKQYIKHRLYRKNCIQIYQSIYAKDLRIINRDLSSMVLIDNAPYSYIFQLQNGIPILPYYTGEDNQLLLLQKYLQDMAKCDDVRECNKKYFKLHKYGDFKQLGQMVQTLFFNSL